MKSSSIFSWINRRSYSQKFVAIGLLFALALTGFYPMARDQLLRREQYGVKELQGTLYLRPFSRLLEDVTTYHLLGVQAAHGEDVTEQLRQHETAVTTSLAEVNEWHILYAESLLLEDELANIEASWVALQTAVQEGDTENFEEPYNQLNNQLLQLISRIGDTSFLILDPDLDTYYMMDAVLLKLPELQGLLNEVADYTIHADIENEISDVDRLALVALSLQIQSILDKLQRGMETSWENDGTGEMRPLTEPRLQALDEQVDSYLALLDDQIISADPIAPQPDLYALKNAVDEQMIAYYDSTSAALEFGINNRIELYGNRLLFAAGIAAVALAVAMTVGLIQFRNISRPLRELTMAAEKLGAGELSARANVKGEDEASRVALVFNRMATDLQLTQQRLREQVDALSKLTKSLEASASISRQLASTLETEKLVSETIGQIQLLFNYNYVQFYLLDETGEKLVLAGGTGQAGQELFARGHSVSIAKGLVGQAAATNAPVLVGDVAQVDVWVANPLLPNTQAELAVPVSVGKVVFGVLDVQENRKDAFSEEDVALLQSVATAAALSLQNARLYEQAQQSARHEAVLNQINQEVLAAPNMERVLQVAAKGLGSSLNVRRATVQLSRQVGNGRFQEKN